MKEIALHILDIAQNSIAAGATLIEISVDEQAQRDMLAINVRDNGRGMSADMLSSVESPFSTTRTTRRIGLGIPLFKAGVEAAGGDFSIESEVGKGTLVTARYRLSHIDRPPLGDMAQTVSAIIAGREDVDYIYRHSVGEKDFVFDTREARNLLAPVSLGQPEVVVWIREYISEGINELNGGA
ncbi:MAG: ATP-binding protein [Christensenellales bacterium]|jgi:anti-sigma regulatory factor (Ser/Thr protein kinase)